MAVSITGIVINLAILVIIFILLGFGWGWNNDLHTCETKASPFCYSIACPCEADPSKGPCSGYAKRPGPNGTWYCSDSPDTLVDNNGQIIQ